MLNLVLELGIKLFAITNMNQLIVLLLFCQIICLYYVLETISLVIKRIIGIIDVREYEREREMMMEFI